MSFRFSLCGQVGCDGTEDGIDCVRGLPGTLLVFGATNMPADVEPGHEVERAVLSAAVLPLVVGKHFGWSFVTWGAGKYRYRAVYCPEHRSQAEKLNRELNESGVGAVCETHTPWGSKPG